MQIKTVLNLVVTLSYLIKSIESFSFMVPQDSCFDMKPKHNTSSELTLPPYRIIPTKLNYLPLESIRG
jgi:hypothetical protein